MNTNRLHEKKEVSFFWPGLHGDRQHKSLPPFYFFGLEIIKEDTVKCARQCIGLGLRLCSSLTASKVKLFQLVFITVKSEY